MQTKPYESTGNLRAYRRVRRERAQRYIAKGWEILNEDENYSHLYKPKGSQVGELWAKLNAARLEAYKRFQHQVARHHAGRWIRGIVIFNGQTKFYFE